MEAHTGSRRESERERETVAETTGQRETEIGVEVGVGGAWQELALFGWRQEALECGNNG